MTPQTSPQTGETVRRMWCHLCDVSWSFVPPIWLGDPWPRESAERVFAGHMRHVHPTSPNNPTNNQGASE